MASDKNFVKSILKQISQFEANIIAEEIIADIKTIFETEELYGYETEIKSGITRYDENDTDYLMQKYFDNDKCSTNKILKNFYIFCDGYIVSVYDFQKKIYTEWLIEKAAVIRNDCPKGTISKKILDYMKNNKNAFSLYSLSKKQLKNAFLYNPIYNKKITSSVQKIEEILPDNLAELYPAARLYHRKFILHVGDTNSGKTYQAINRFMEADSGVYLAPLRLLAMEVQDKTNQNGVLCSLLTGEEDDLIKEATHMSSTIEMLSLNKRYDVAVIDEAQMIADKNRGWAWTKAVLGVCADEIHICMSENATDIICKLITLCGDEYEIVEHTRSTPLVFEKKKIFKFPESVQEKDALIVFSRKKVLLVASELKKRGIKASKIYGSLPYAARKREVEKFINGETSVVVSTDAIGMGMNLPIQRVVFLETEKYDGEDVRNLEGPEVKQIAGRAGRRGMFDTGFVNVYTEDIKSNYKKVNIQKALTEKYGMIEKARIRLPEELLTVSNDFKFILKLWENMQNEDFYEKTDLTDAYIKNKEIDNFLKRNKAYKITNEEKWKLINVPIDYDEKNLYPIWCQLMQNYCTNTPIRFELDVYIDELMDGSLGDLELLYRILDAFYAFQRVEREKDEKFREEIKAYKKKVAEIIMKKLEVNMVKKCKRCGKRLAWNSKYNICDSCYFGEFWRW